MSKTEHKPIVTVDRPTAEGQARIVVDRPSFAGKIDALKAHYPDLYEDFHDRLDKGMDVPHIATWLRIHSGISLSESEIIVYDDARSRGPEHLARFMAGERREIPEELQNRPRATLREQLISELRDKATEMLDEARKDPESDANQIIEILLIDQMVNEGVKVNETKLLLAEQRERAKLKEHIRDLKKKAQVAEGRLRIQQRGLNLREKQLKAAKKSVEAARKDIREGRPFDPREVVEKFSAAIGLSGPPERRVEQ